ncbi:MAG: hypothetical protein KJ720_18650 [Proteobacteria bacterium]|nr:hypothetical protein [Pseudomonadota bacterium]MBU1451926.1 hypothetical protein [Pseudomonadota bacterium]
MRKNLDIFFGLAAWAIGIFTVADGFSLFGAFWVEWPYWPAPLLWIICVVLMFVFRTRRPLKLWWVWPSFPLAFIMWVLFVPLAFKGI